MAEPTLVVLAKEPVPGRVKTRLTAAYTPEEAARLAAAALADTLAAAVAVPGARVVLALDGSPGPWVPPGVPVVGQRAGGLDVRIAGAFADAARPGAPTLLVGMDTPQVTPRLLADALAALAGADAALGHAADGGFWALGLHVPDDGLLLGVPMSTDTTGAVQEQRLRDAGLAVALLPPLRDVDTPDDAAAVAAEAPGSRFAALVAELSAVTR